MQSALGLLLSHTTQGEWQTRNPFTAKSGYVQPAVLGADGEGRQLTVFSCPHLEHVACVYTYTQEISVCFLRTHLWYIKKSNLKQRNFLLSVLREDTLGGV